MDRLRDDPDLAVARLAGLGFMDWPTSPAARQAAATAADDPAAAARLLKTLTVVDALGACALIAQTAGRAVFREVVRAFHTAAGLSLDRAVFAVRIAEAGFIPVVEGYGVDPLDYQFARQFVLKVRDEPALVAAMGWPPESRGIASTRPFYPDLTRNVNGWRQRIVAAAVAHRDKGPISPQQWALFSLGSLYALTRARAATRPIGGSTSIHFARSVLHAAGCNVIRPGNTVTELTAGGLFAALPKEVFGYVPASELDRGGRPDVGDIFHIQGANYTDADGRPIADSSHVGVILGVWGTIWLTIEGGSGDHMTRQRTRELVPVSSPLGQWAFKYDEAAAAVGPRPVQGWYSVARMRPDLWMAPPPDTIFESR
jgi:hypothetical protein